MSKGANRRHRVLVTGLFEPAALAVIRRLGSDGWHVTAADGHRMAYGLCSRYAARRGEDPLPALVLCAYILTHAPRLLLTSYDSTELFMFHNRYMEG